MRRIFIILFAIAVLVIAGFYWLQSKDAEFDTDAPAQAAKLGVLVDLSGDGSDWGQTELNAVKLAIQDFNSKGGLGGEKIDIAVEDAPAADIDRSVSAFQRLTTSEQIFGIVGPTWDDVAAAVAPLSDRQEVVVIAPDASSGIEKSRDYKYFFSTFSPEASEMTALASFLKSQNFQRVGVVYNQDPFSQQFRDSFVEAARKNGLATSSDFPIGDPDTRDFRSIITRLISDNVDAVYVETTNQSAKGPFMRQVQELGLQSLIVSSSTTDTQSTLDEFGSLLNGLTFARAVESDRQRQFLDRYKRAYGTVPKAPSAPYAYDAASLLLAAYSSGARSSSEIREYLLSLDGYEGVSSPNMSFTSTGRVVWPESSYAVVRLMDGKVVPFK